MQESEKLNTLNVDTENAMPQQDTATHQLAASHAAHPDKTGKALLLLQDMEYYTNRLQQAHQYFIKRAAEDFTVPLAGEWLLDNFYIVQQAIRQISEDMPPQFYRKLPKLTGTALVDYPRVFALSRAITSEAVHAVNLHDIQVFLQEYQIQQPLATGELWALPTMLRIVNLENLTWAVSELAETPLPEVDYELPVAPDNLETDTVVANSITNLRTLATQDWLTFFETVSRVEAILQRDPSGVYSLMDFQTRNRYRNEIERYAPMNGEREEQIASIVIDLAQKAQDSDAHSRTAHIGYYLLDDGQDELQAAIGFVPTVGQRIKHWLQKHNFFFYILSISLITAAILAMIAVVGVLFSPLQMLFLMLIVIFPVSVIAVETVNWFITRTLPPCTLPRLDYSKGIPSEQQTIIAIPAMLTDEAEIDSLVHQVEQHYIRNYDDGLLFALLLDYADAPEQHTPADKPLLDYAIQRIRTINEKHTSASRQPFYLFVRERRWNPAEQVWMAWERKRGKLSEFNRFIAEPEFTSSFVVTEGDLTALRQSRYVITLDADTILPKGSAARLIATMAHPLNQVVYNERKDKIVAGYAVMQPRVQIMPGVANQSRFTRIYAGDTSLDLYTLAVSDVYQDCFGEGTYIGKGIYDLRAFETVLQNRVPENRLLSHDLFESIYARTALVTDVVLLEDYPPHYLAYMLRLHRWIRGDWQLLPWLLSRQAQFSALGYWKVFDNLRRSLVSPAMLLLLILGWTVLPGSPLLWTGIVVAASGFPFFATVFNLLTGLPKRPNWQSISQDLQASLLRWMLYLVFLPHDALIHIDAIITTLWRLLRRKNLLHWVTAAHTVRLFGDAIGIKNVMHQMHTTLILGIITTLLVAYMRPMALFIAFPFLLAWILSLPIASYISKTEPQEMAKLDSNQIRQLQRIARRTWLFFEQYVGPEDNWLPPDHYQETPRAITAHHTSPTNIGLMLLSTLAAYDFGYIGLLGLLTRLQFTFETMNKLERYRGHFLNWYDTRRLVILQPRYVSTVDSGNLAGALIALKSGIQQVSEKSVIADHYWSGLGDTVGLLMELLEASDALQASPGAIVLLKQLDDFRSKLQFEPPQFANADSVLNAFWENMQTQVINLLESTEITWDSHISFEFRIFYDRLRQHIENIKRSENLLIPYVFVMRKAPQDFGQNPQTEAVWRRLSGLLEMIPSLRNAATIYNTALLELATLREVVQEQSVLVQWCDELEQALNAALQQSNVLNAQLQQVLVQIDTYIQEMDFRFLFNDARKIFHIGYNMETQQLDNSYYDLLASEARIASLVAIATNQIPQEHWMHLSRPLSNVDGVPTLKSWSGTMFEYLMPRLITETYAGTLLDSAYHAAVTYQMNYGKRNNVPWGISESGYYAFDSNMKYQYRAFGAPELAFKRGQGVDMVVAPYASLLALPIMPQAVLDNAQHLNSVGAYGTYGYYEAIDYTQQRLPLGEEYAIVKEYMAHHQGMILLTLVNFLQDDVMVSRFHANPYIESVQLLLQERMPGELQIVNGQPDDVDVQHIESKAINTNPWQPPIVALVPQVHFLSNGRYGVLITSTGAGYSQWQKLALTRWYADTTREDWGMWIYLLDEETQALWSITQQPAPDGDYRTWFHTHQAVFRSETQGIVAQMQITVAPDDDVEIRRVRLTNNTDSEHRLFYTSYGEVVLAPRMSDQRHPAFSKLFIETEYLEDISALLFYRRKRSADEKEHYMLHMLLGTDALPVVSNRIESDRRDFLGRNHTDKNPMALINEARAFDGISATTIDPIMALGHRIQLQPHESVEFAYITMAGDSRQAVIAAAQKYRSWSTIDYAFSKARYQSELELQQVDIDAPQIERFQKLLSALLYPQPGLRADADILAQNKLGQSGLWVHGVSGDYPICLVRLSDENELPIVQDLLEAHRYWRKRNIQVTLVILNQRDTGYTQELYNQVHRLVSRMSSETWLSRHDGIFILRADMMDENARTLLAASARVYLDASQGSLEQQLQQLVTDRVYLPDFTPTYTLTSVQEPTPELQRPANLLFDNGYGGFDADTGDYIIFRTADSIPPAPWINVIANPDMGFSITEAGGGFSWAVNSSENRLTTWRNDSVSDMPSEIIYVRDEETGIIWTPTPLPAPTENPYLIRHSKGYSRFVHHSFGLEQELTLYVDANDPIKILKIQFKNNWQRTRRLTITYYVEWVLGTLRDITQQYLIPEYDSDQRTVLAHNPYSIDFGESYLFVTASQDFHGMTTDRREFLGRLNDYRQPAGLKRIGLSSRVAAGDDTCAAIQLHLNLEPNATDSVYFVLGGGISRDEALRLSQKYQQNSEIERAWLESRRMWENIINSVQVETPEPSMNLLLPWLHYQALACRIWGRSALYQSGGAYGFRDQLQDVMSVIHSRPDVAREHIQRAARHQFEAGDVLHWWHPPLGRGVRTRFSDDLIWLPFVTAYYVTTTGDTSILEECEPFLQGEPLKPDEEERYDYYQTGTEKFTLYEHCKRALDRAMTRGRNGLPLMGSGDWNDGMNRVGIEGEGESVWVAWFLITTLRDFIPLCEYMEDAEQIARYESEIEHYRNAIEQNAWDGEWYRRAYYDDGTPLGSAQNRECRIDSLVQSWAVLSEAAQPERAKQAMTSALTYLVKPEDKLLLLFTPAFDETPKDPGYIKAYPPGVRENGGQYTHAALWMVWALAKMGNGRRAETLFRMLNPILHSATQADAQLYRVEPYVIAADVYGVEPYIGMGGWTWYTGSSGWMYRLGIEAILGLVREGDKLRLNPSIPPEWANYRITYQFGESTYSIQIENPDKMSHGVGEVLVDGVSQPDLAIPLANGKAEYQVIVRLR